MRRLLTRLGGPAVAVMLTVGPARPAQAAGPAYFEFTDAGRRTAVVRIDDPGTIQHARDLLSGATDQQPHILGRIVKSPAAYNPKWSFHYDPGTVHFFDVMVEVCDATTPFVEDHLDEAGGSFLPGLFWCPWTSRLTREVPAP
ncbi:calmodulin-binding protein [Streptomyces thermoviolaceus]|uniref:BP74-related protein n=1 Tax=Streptomyces thermoviolaceus TaxID=1952 RepID=UPI00203EDE3E|nr:calmodulin-binding protein [Streptomyces thermoviolaceus]MCM3265940.1 calmodulin-binding protein [Streptomyces thermoviolaceus]